jgi:hypothetical protein
MYSLVYVQGYNQQENLSALQRAIDSMEEKGLQEDPRYSQLIALRNRQGMPTQVLSNCVFHNIIVATLILVHIM